MTDWKIIKDASPPVFDYDNTWESYKHSFKPLVLGQKDTYNEGGKILDSSSPIWTMSDGTQAITPVHEPCGYWQNKDIKRRKFLPRIITTTGPPSREITWSSQFGGALGRYVLSTTYGPFLYYSDDGGVSWNQASIPMAIYTLTTLHTNSGDVYIGYIGDTDAASGYSKSLISYDGITWIAGTVGIGASSFDSFLYDPVYEIFLGFASTGGSLSRVLYSLDGLNWTFAANVSYYCGYRGSVKYKNAYYIFAYNYPIEFIDYGDPRAAALWNGIPFDQSPYKYNQYFSYLGQVATDGNVIVYDYCYFDGKQWIGSNHHVTNIDYNEEKKYFASVSQLAGYDSLVSFSFNGIDWLDYYTNSRYGNYDVAAGNDRVVVAHWNNSPFIILLGDYL